jgi:ATP-binding cassette subfamily C (CFTR/MRP) protein 1
LQDVIDAIMTDTLRMTLLMVISALFTFVMISIVTPWFLVPFVPVFALYLRTQSFYRSCSREIKRIDAITVIVLCLCAIDCDISSGI